MGVAARCYWCNTVVQRTRSNRAESGEYECHGCHTARRMVEGGLESLDLDLAVRMANHAVAALRGAQAERFAEAHPESYREAWKKRKERLGPMSAFFTNVLRRAKKLP